MPGTQSPWAIAPATLEAGPGRTAGGRLCVLQPGACRAQASRRGIRCPSHPPGLSPPHLAVLRHRLVAWWALSPVLLPAPREPVSCSPGPPRPAVWRGGSDSMRFGSRTWRFDHDDRRKSHVMPENCVKCLRGKTHHGKTDPTANGQLGRMFRCLRQKRLVSIWERTRR